MNRLPLEPRAYLWDPATDPHPGAIFVRGCYIKVFIPHEELVSVADALIDLYEQQSRAGVETWAAQRAAGLTPSEASPDPISAGGQDHAARPA